MNSYKITVNSVDLADLNFDKNEKFITESQNTFKTKDAQNVIVRAISIDELLHTAEKHQDYEFTEQLLENLNIKDKLLN